MNFTIKMLTVIALVGTMIGEGGAEGLKADVTEEPYQLTVNMQAQANTVPPSSEVDNNYGPAEQNGQPSSGSIDITNKSRNSLLQITLSANSRRDGAETTFPVGLEATFGQLFSTKESDLYSGFYRVTGKIDSDSTMRLNATAGYSLPGIGGETILSYRLLNSRLRTSFDLSGDFQENAIEQGFALEYNRYFSSFIRSFGVNIAYTDLNGKSTQQILESDIEGIWTLARTTTGFSDVETGAVTLQTAMGSEDWDYPLFKGFRLDLDVGYEEVRYEEFQNIAGTTDHGLTASATAAINTIIGQGEVGYHTGEASNIVSLAFGSSALKVYLRDIDYRAGNKETVYGISLSGDLDDLLNPGRYFATLFSPKAHLFRENNTGYDNILTTRHIAKFNNDQFVAKPRINEVKENIFVVNKRALPANVELDTNRQILVVFTQSPLRRIISVSPANAASAFSLHDGRLEIYIKALPIRAQTLTVKATEADGGETWVSLKTSVGSLHIDSVVVRENLNNPVTVPPTNTPAPDEGNQGPDTAPAPEPPVEEPALNQAPTAVIAVNGYSRYIQGQPGIEAELHGLQSSDPEDDSVSSYSWSVSGDCSGGSLGWGRGGPAWYLIRTNAYTGFNCVATLEVCDSEGLCDTTTFTIPDGEAIWGN